MLQHRVSKSVMAISLPVKTKRVLKGQMKSLRVKYARWRHQFEKEALAAALSQLGLREGGLVMVHSSFDRFEAFSGKPTDAISAIEEVVGLTGTVLMTRRSLSAVQRRSTHVRNRSSTCAVRPPRWV